MAFVRFKGPYAYLVENERQGSGDESRVRQRVLLYLGREPRIDEDVVAEVARRFPDANVDWDEVRAALAARGEAAPAAKRTPRRRVPKKPPADEWLDWD